MTIVGGTSPRVRFRVPSNYLSFGPSRCFLKNPYIAGVVSRPFCPITPCVPSAEFPYAPIRMNAAFLRLECGHWNADEEKALRDTLKTRKESCNPTGILF